MTTELVVERIETPTFIKYRLSEPKFDWSHDFKFAQAVQDHIEMWFAGYIVEWRVDHYDS